MVAICVFCASSNDIDQRWLDLAREVGEPLMAMLRVVGERPANVGVAIDLGKLPTVRGEEGYFNILAPADGVEDAQRPEQARQAVAEHTGDVGI